MEVGRGGLRIKLPKQYCLQTQGLGPYRASSETLGQVTSSFRDFVSLSVKWVYNTNKVQAKGRDSPSIGYNVSEPWEMLLR